MHTLIQRMRNWGSQSWLGRLLYIILCERWPGVRKAILLVRCLISETTSTWLDLGSLAWSTSHHNRLGIPVVWRRTDVDDTNFGGVQVDASVFLFFFSSWLLNHFLFSFTLMGWGLRYPIILIIVLIAISMHCILKQPSQVLIIRFLFEPQIPAVVQIL